MHATERETIILSLLLERGFVSFRELESTLEGSPATIRRDLERLNSEGKITRVRGGAKANKPANIDAALDKAKLHGTPFSENVALNPMQKEAIGRAAAALCQSGEGVMIDGGSTTFQMCRFLSGLNLQILTNSLHIVSPLADQKGTRVLVPGGAVFPEQNIVLPLFGEDLTPAFHAPKLFLGCSAIGPRGLMQDDVVLVASQRRFIDRAEQIILLADASKFANTSGNIVCKLDEIDVLITDDRIDDNMAKRIRSEGVELIIANK